MLIFDKQVIDRKKYDMNCCVCIELVGLFSSPKVIIDLIFKHIILYLLDEIIVFTSSSKCY